MEEVLQDTDLAKYFDEEFEVTIPVSSSSLDLFSFFLSRFPCSL